MRRSLTSILVLALSSAGLLAAQASHATPPGTVVKRTRDSKTQSSAPTVAWIPLKGTVGLDASEQSFSAAAFRRCADQVRKSGCKILVLEIDSPGGRVDTKEEVIREILRLSDSGVRTIAFVHDAGSAAALITLACNEIFVMPASRVGAAVTILVGDTGPVSMKKVLKDDPELEAKFRSFSSAIDDEAARATKRCPCIARAMKEKEAELWHSPSGGFSDTSGAPEVVRIDSNSDVLTLTYTLMLSTGFAKRATSSEDMLDQLEVKKQSVLDLSSEIRSDERQLQKLIKTFEAQLNSLEEYQSLVTGGGSNRQLEASRQKTMSGKKKKLEQAYEKVIEHLKVP